MSRIVFSPPLVAAILEGRKTMTRRVNVPKSHPHGVLEFHYPCKPFDRLAVAETHWAFGHWEHVQKKCRMGWQFVCDRPYDIRFEPVTGALRSMDKAHPQVPTWYKRNARFMPTSYARLYIEVTAVRVERLQDISESDAVAEGIDEKAINHFGCTIKAFQALWNSLGRDDETEWAGNPWVTAIKFRRVS